MCWWVGAIRIRHLDTRLCERERHVPTGEGSSPQDPCELELELHCWSFDKSPPVVPRHSERHSLQCRASPALQFGGCCSIVLALTFPAFKFIYLYVWGHMVLIKFFNGFLSQSVEHSWGKKLSVLGLCGALEMMERIVETMVQPIK